MRLPAHLTASGRAMLALMPRAQVRALYAEPGSFVLRNDRGPRSLSALRQLLAEARRRGFASEDGEVTPGFASVAVAASDRAGYPAAAVAVTFPSAEVDARGHASASPPGRPGPPPRSAGGWAPPGRAGEARHAAGRG